MARKLKWGILSTGAIANAFAHGLQNSARGELVAVASRTAEKAKAFCPDMTIPHRHGDYDALLHNPEVEAVYIATPHPHHAEWVIRAADAGKHILCEKPLGLNHAEAMAMVEAAHRNGVFLMEAFMYRCHPQTAKIVEAIRDGVLGEVKVIQATFSFAAGFNPESRLYKNALGGGGILDVGCYCTSMARLIAGAALGRDFADPLDLHASGHVGATGVDEYACAVLRFEKDIVAQLSTGVALGQENVVRVFGTEGHLVVPSPWIINPRGGTSQIVIHRYGEPKPRKVNIRVAKWLYAIEADTVAAHLRKGQAPSPAMTWDDTLGNMRTLDRWREALGVVYEAESPAGRPLPLSGRPLARREPTLMQYGEIRGVPRPVSRLVMGVDNQFRMPHAEILFDDYFERGGNCFDTAWIYGQGACETILGKWIANRGVRDQVVILDKGAHTPWCNPEDLTRQLHEQLRFLGTDRIDIYLMHRDNEEVPVGEFVDCLNEHKRAGRIGIFGGSNWSLRRLQEANAYAASKGLEGFTAVSNQYALARMVNPPWAGCLSAREPGFEAWLKKSGTALMPWSSQARGFFTDRARPDNTSDPELVRCWYADDNFERQKRAIALAAKKKVLPIQIALAWVLRKPYPVFALIGPRAVAETRVSVEALKVRLTAKETDWLNLERDSAD